MQWAVENVETWGRIEPIQFGVPTKQKRMDEVDSIESSLADGSHIQPELLEATGTNGPAHGWSFIAFDLYSF